MATFFKRYLGVNWWCDSEKGDVFILAPALVGSRSGQEYPGDPRGTCVFFTKERTCQIHAAKPYHCSHGNPCAFDEGGHKRDTAQSVKLWLKEQAQIATLLKRSPVASEFSPFGLFSGLFF